VEVGGRGYHPRPDANLPSRAGIHDAPLKLGKRHQAQLALHRLDDILRQEQVGVLLRPHLMEALHDLFRGIQDQLLRKLCPVSQVGELIEREILVELAATEFQS